MRVPIVTLLLFVISFNTAWAEAHLVGQTEVVTLDELAQRTARFSESNPDDADALKQLGQAWLESYASGRRYFVLDVIPDGAPPWTLCSTPLIPLFDNDNVRRRPGDGTEELGNAMRALENALKRSPSSAEINVLVAFSCLMAARHEAIMGVPLSIRPEIPQSDSSSPEVGPWEHRALALCRAVIDREPVEKLYRQDDPWGYACSMMHYLFEESGVKPRSEEELYQAAGGKENYNFLKDALQLPVDASAKPRPADLAIINSLYPEIPREQNGALIYLDAMDALVEDYVLSDDLEMTDFLSTLNQESKPENFESRIDALLEANTTSLDLMRRASAIGAWRYPVDFASDWDFVSAFGFGGGGRGLAELLHMRALHGVLGGRADVVVDSIRLLAILANSVRNEPIVISQLVRGALVARVVQMSEQLVSKLPQNDVKWDEVQSILESLDNFSGVRATWQVERMSIDRPVIDEDINVPSIGLEYTDLTSEQKEKSLSRLGLERKARIDLLDELLAKTSWEAVYTEVLAPRELEEIDKRVFVSTLSRSAQLRAAITALAIERYRARHGDFPTDLSALAPEFAASEYLVDPFSGTLLQWRTTDNGFVVHSLGDPDDVKTRMERAQLSADGQDPLRWLSFKVAQ